MLSLRHLRYATLMNIIKIIFGSLILGRKKDVFIFKKGVFL